MTEAEEADLDAEQRAYADRLLAMTTAELTQEALRKREALERCCRNRQALALLAWRYAELIQQGRRREGQVVGACAAAVTLALVVAWLL